MTAILARLRRGFARMPGWVRAGFKRRPTATAGQLDQERETTASLGLMAQAAAAGAEMTPEQQIFLSQSEHGMRERLSVLLGIPHRSLAQEREKLAIEGWLARGAAAPEAPAPVRRFGFMPAMASANPLAGVLMSPITWVALAFAAPASFAAVQGWRLDHAKADLAETRQELSDALASAAAWRERSEEYRQGLIDAANVARNAAAALEAERAADARRAARERRRNREIANVLTNSPEPPQWRLREPPPAEDQPTSP